MSLPGGARGGPAGRVNGGRRADREGLGGRSHPGSFHFVVVRRPGEWCLMNGTDYGVPIVPTTPGSLIMAAVERLPGDELCEPCI